MTTMRPIPLEYTTNHITHRTPRATHHAPHTTRHTPHTSHHTPHTTHPTPHPRKDRWVDILGEAGFEVVRLHVNNITTTYHTEEETLARLCAAW